MNLLFSFLILIISSVIIYYSGDKFAEASSALGDYLKIPRTVKGATFDAVSSSLPELMISIFSLIAFHKFQLGIGTIVGSALFNLLFIVAIIIFVSPISVKISRDIVKRDMLFYSIAIVLLLLAVIFTNIKILVFASVFIFVYLIYIFSLVKFTKKNKVTEKPKEITISKTILSFSINIIIIIFASYFLTSSAVSISEILRISPLIVGFVIVAAATSVPDAVISYSNARKGDIGDSITNVIGSNIFDILIGLSIPIFIAVIIGLKPVLIFGNIELIIGLLFSTLLLAYLFNRKKLLNKKHAFLFLVLYIIFILYAIYLAYIWLYKLFLS